MICLPIRASGEDLRYHRVRICIAAMTSRKKVAKGLLGVGRNPSGWSGVLGVSVRNETGRL